MDGLDKALHSFQIRVLGGMDVVEAGLSLRPSGYFIELVFHHEKVILHIIYNLPGSDLLEGPARLLSTEGSPLCASVALSLLFMEAV